MRYSAMLGHANDSWCSPGFCGAGSAAVPGRAVVWSGRGAGHRGAGVGRQPHDHASVVLRVAGGRPAGAEGGRPGRPHAASRPPAVAAGKKNARRRHAWIVFEDESGVSQHPVVRRTWAPRGQPPVLHHTGSNWKRLSIAAALAFRWDGRRTRLYFQTHLGTYTDT